jgi:hypothetical protein
MAIQKMPFEPVEIPSGMPGDEHELLARIHGDAVGEVHIAEDLPRLLGRGLPGTQPSVWFGLKEVVLP